MRGVRGSPRRQPRPRRRVLLVRRLRGAHADHQPLARRLARDALDEVGGEPRHSGEVRPLVRPRPERVVDEQRVALLARLVLERQGDEVAEAAARHGVLVREEPVVRLHAELVAPRHRLGDEVAAHPPRDVRGDRRREEEPDVRAVPGTRALHRRGTPAARQVSTKAATSSFHEVLSKSAARNQQVSSSSIG